MLKKSASRETLNGEQGNDCHFSDPCSSFNVQLFTITSDMLVVDFPITHNGFSETY
jgi:hypothetical protein